jgi:hypothetical protein
MLRSTEIRIAFTIFRWAVILVFLVSACDFIAGGYYFSAILTLATAFIWTASFREFVRKRGDFRLVASLRFVLTILLVMTALTFSGYLKTGAPEPLVLETARNFVP